MTIIEETESEYKTELKLWENSHGKIWIQCAIDETEPTGIQGLEITTNDAKALIQELTRIVNSIEGTEEGEKQKQLKINYQS